ncbi:T9SS type A sorting domain-containing protein [Empedobacter brevis]|uniref:T9SS type A sorting domain-containing protein n=1 Tax=Empedobacter brevis TaxID=247 RepID=UPI00333F2F9C
MKKTILSIALFTLFNVNTMAQWQDDVKENLLISKEHVGSSFSKTSNDGRTYIAFWDNIDTGNYFELRFQILDKDGRKMLGDNGIKVSDKIPMNSYTFIENMAIDQNNNAYLGVTGTGAGNPGFVFKIGPEGDLLWGEEGVNLGEGLLPTILPLSSGDVIVSYWPSSKTTTEVQKISKDGKFVWEKPVKILSDDSSKQTVPADLFELSNGEIQLIFHKILGRGTTSTMFMQRLKNDGSLQYEKPILIADQTTAYNRRNTYFFENDNLFLGYSSGMNGRFDGYLIKINADGTLPWGVNGVDFDTKKTSFEKEMKIASEKGVSHIWAIADYVDPKNLDGTKAIFIQKFSKDTGERIFTDDAKEIIKGTYHNGDLQVYKDQPFFLINDAVPGTEFQELSAILLSNKAEFVWEEKSKKVAASYGFKHHIQLNKPAHGQIVLLFQEVRNAIGDNSTFAQNIILEKENLSIQDMDEEKKSMIYPNPTKDVIYTTREYKNANYQLMNTLGHVLKKGTFSKQINLREFKSGVYFLQIEAEGRITNFKVVKL